ncbi:unnamed protein product [Parajaminaea phylloscopi]
MAGVRASIGRDTIGQRLAHRAGRTTALYRAVNLGKRPGCLCLQLFHHLDSCQLLYTSTMPTDVSPDQIPSLQLEHGPIRGDLVVDSATGKPLCTRFLGVPYALPPTGSRRWQKPQPLPSQFRYEDRKYTKFGPKCPQPEYLHKYSLPAAPSVQDEDCLLLNIWAPAGSPPPGGWPILFHIHGGWLQIGDANQDVSKDLAYLVAPVEAGGAGVQAICVNPTYRLGVFGFFGSSALDAQHGQANFGFFDQRCALEFVHRQAAALGGDPDKITVSGLSAGSQSAHAQVLHEYSLSQLSDTYKPIIKRCLLRSGTALLPCKGFDGLKEQFAELLAALDIDAADDGRALSSLREVPFARLVEVVSRMSNHTFRAVDDGGPQAGGFVSDEWRQEMRNGAFSKWCKRHGVSFMIGEVANEDGLYRLINPPKPSPTYHDGLLVELGNYYTSDLVQKLLPNYSLPAESNDAEKWADVYGYITSDAQVFVAERLLFQYLVRPEEGGLGPDDVLRFRLERRADFYDLIMPQAAGVYHSTCDSIFKFMKEALLTGPNQGEAQRDVRAFAEWLGPFGEWVQGEHDTAVRGWYGGRQPEAGIVRVLRRDGSIEATGDPVEKQKMAMTARLEEAIFS